MPKNNTLIGRTLRIGRNIFIVAIIGAVLFISLFFSLIFELIH